MKLSSLFSIGRSLALAVTIGFTALAQATPITYFFTGRAAGSFTPTNEEIIGFTDRLMEVTITTDTSNIDTSRFGPGIPATNVLVPGTIDLAGFGIASFLNPLYVFVNHGTETVGFGDLAHNDLVNVRRTDVDFDTYDLKSAHAPVTGTPPNFVFQFQDVALSNGSLTISRLDVAEFRAVLGDNTVPEPQTLALVMVALAVVGAKARRQRDA